MSSPPAPDASSAVVEEARAAMEAWEREQPSSFYESDAHFRRILPLHVPPERWAALEVDLVRFGVEAAGPVDALVRTNNETANLPRLERYSAYGRRVEAIVHHPSYEESGRYIYGSGILAAYADHPRVPNGVGVLSRAYLSMQNGEAGHNCPIACTAGVIRALQTLGTEEQKARYLPGLLSRDWDTHLEGAQFLTEIQGGSDVGANATVATREPDGTYRIRGEKWFATNIDADLFLMTARFEGAPTGTRGLGLFLVPRLLDDASVNAFHIRRLKDKIGTRTVASSEVDFEGALAYHLGDPESGFRNMMELVIRTSRLMNAIGAAAMARRSYVVAQTYARHRKAFGQAILEYPLVQESLADMRAEAEAMLSSTLYLAARQDEIDAAGGKPDSATAAFVRMAVDLNKTRTAASAREIVTQAILVLGGNGAIETFSVLPRLLRDAIVFENWEGTPNTLLMQSLRDAARYHVHEGFFAHLDRMLGAAPGPLADELGAEARSARKALSDRLGTSGPLEEAALALRPWLDRIAVLVQAVVRLVEEARLGSGPTPATLEHFVDTRLRGRRARETDPRAYLERIRAISAGV